MNKIDIIILLGGFGTRLKSISNGLPKALMPVGNNLFLDLIINKLSHYNISNIYLSLYYKPNLFKTYIERLAQKEKIKTIIEPEPLGTGGAVKYVIEKSDLSSPFFVINGDSLSDINLNNMEKRFEDNQFMAMLGVSEINDVQRYGRVSIKNETVISFNEKGILGNGLINNGYYIFNQECFESYSGPFSLEKVLFTDLIRKQGLGAYKVDNDNFIDIGIPRDYKKLCSMFETLK